MRGCCSPSTSEQVVGVAIVAFALLFAGLVGCGAGAVPEPTSAHVAAIRARWPSVSHAELARGRTLYVDRCSGCHTLVPPAERTPEQWPGDVEAMAGRSALDPAAKQAVVRYLVATSAVAHTR